MCLNSNCLYWEAVAWRCSMKKLFLEISQNWQENTCARVYFLIKLQDSTCKSVDLTHIAYIQKQPLAVFCKKDVLKNFAKFLAKHLCQTWNTRPQRETCNFIKKETLAQTFSYEFYEITKNTFFHRTPPAAASVYWDLLTLPWTFFNFLLES